MRLHLAQAHRAVDGLGCGAHAVLGRHNEGDLRLVDSAAAAHGCGHRHLLATAAAAAHGRSHRHLLAAAASRLVLAEKVGRHSAEPLAGALAHRSGRDLRLCDQVWLVLTQLDTTGQLTQNAVVRLLQPVRSVPCVDA